VFDVLTTLRQPRLFGCVVPHRANTEGDLTLRTKLTAATALAGSLMFATLGWGLSGSANAAPTPALQHDAGMLTLVAQEGGGGDRGASASGGGGGVVPSAPDELMAAIAAR
jgi:hypothetical protein